MTHSRRDDRLTQSIVVVIIYKSLLAHARAWRAKHRRALRLSTAQCKQNSSLRRSIIITQITTIAVSSLACLEQFQLLPQIVELNRLLSHVDQVVINKPRRETPILGRQRHQIHIKKLNVLFVRQPPLGPRERAVLVKDGGETPILHPP